MISEYDLIRSLRRWKDEQPDFPFTFDEKERVIHYDTHDVTFDEMLDNLRKKMHCDFETVYYMHVEETLILRCCECGAIIFSGEDEERYDPNLRCPVCCHDESVCRNNYWTAEEIASNPEKQRVIQAYEEAYADLIEHDKRVTRRGGLQDWELKKKRFKAKHFMLDTNLECDDVTRSHVKGLRLHLTRWIFDPELDTFRWKDDTVIPLSFSAAIMYWVRMPKARKHMAELKEKGIA